MSTFTQEGLAHVSKDLTVDSALQKVKSESWTKVDAGVSVGPYVLQSVSKIWFDDPKEPKTMSVGLGFPAMQHFKLEVFDFGSKYIAKLIKDMKIGDQVKCIEWIAEAGDSETKCKVAPGSDYFDIDPDMRQSIKWQRVKCHIHVQNQDGHIDRIEVVFEAGSIQTFLAVIGGVLVGAAVVWLFSAAAGAGATVGSGVGFTTNMSITICAVQ